MNALIYWFIGIQNTTQVYLLHSVDYFQKKIGTMFVSNYAG